jgi:hypothetical protein
MILIFKGQTNLEGGFSVMEEHITLPCPYPNFFERLILKWILKCEIKPSMGREIMDGFDFLDKI